MPKQKMTTEIPVYRIDRKRKQYDIPDHVCEQHTADNSSDFPIEITDTMNPTRRKYRRKCCTSVTRKKDKERKRLQRMQASQPDTDFKQEMDASTDTAYCSTYGVDTTTRCDSRMDDAVIVRKLHRRKKQSTVYKQMYHFCSKIRPRKVFRNKCKQIYNRHYAIKRPYDMKNYRTVTKYKQLKKTPTSQKFKTCLPCQYSGTYVNIKTQKSNFQDSHQVKNGSGKTYKDGLPHTQGFVDSNECKYRNSAAVCRGFERHPKYRTYVVQNYLQFQHGTKKLRNEINKEAISNTDNLNMVYSGCDVGLSHALAFHTQNCCDREFASIANHYDSTKHECNLDANLFHINTNNDENENPSPKESAQDLLCQCSKSSDQIDFQQGLKMFKTVTKKAKRRQPRRCFSSAARKKDKERKRCQRLQASQPDKSFHEQMDSNRTSCYASTYGTSTISDHGNGIYEGNQINPANTVMDLDMRQKIHRERNRSYSKKIYHFNLKFKDRKKRMLTDKYFHNYKGYRDRKREYDRRRYRTVSKYSQLKKTKSSQKYKTSLYHQKRVKYISIQKYRENPQHRQKVKDASIEKYRQNIPHRQHVKDASKLKYRHNLSHQQAVMESSKWKYCHDFTFRDSVKTRLRNAYEKDSDIKKKKVQMNRKRRKQQKKSMTNLALFFKQQVRDGPKYTCCVCHKFKFRKQVHICDLSKYTKKGRKAQMMAQRCITYQYCTKCTHHCQTNCKIANHNRLWVCFTCHYHLLKGEMPAEATTNNLLLKSIPSKLGKLNPLERQLLSLRIPFMKLLSLPKGGQKGVVGPCVSIPTDVERTTKLLPRCERDSELVKVKLKRKLIYKGHYQYQYICPTKVQTGLQYLQENNEWYSDTQFDKSWESPVVETQTTDEVMPDDSDEQQTLNNSSNNLENQHMEDEDEEAIKSKGLPFDTCLQPADIGQDMLDQYFDGIFCIAPGEGKTPVSMLTEKGNEAMSFPVQFPDGKNTYDTDRPVRLTRSRYFHARLLNADNRFSTDSQYIFYAQYLSELEQVVSQVSIALRKGTNTDHIGTPITAEMMKDPNTLKKILRTDQGYKFLTPIRGTPPYWQSTLKDLFAIIRQLGIPTWFCTFSAADMRWTEVMEILLEQQGIEQSPDELDWLQKCEVLRNSAIMNAITFDHRFHTLLKQIIIDRGVIGKVKDHFHRIEFQQRGSPHTHCLFWIDNAPLLDRDGDRAVCSFVDEYISCALPSEEDSELHEIVNSVQKHSTGHSKACKKKGMNADLISLGHLQLELLFPDNKA